MAGGLDEDDPLVLRCFPPLVFAEEIKHNCFGFDFGSGSSINASKDPKMLCFGGFDIATNSGRESGSICMGSTSLSSTTLLPKSNKKRKGSGDEPGTNLGRPSGSPTGSQRSSKKQAKSTNPTHSVACTHAKIVKKEKLGERITALQQLVSPFGKTDTASVLHETYGYIRFLQDQVQVLCSPFLHRPTAGNDQEIVNCEKKNMALRSKGLCLVPIELTLHVSNESNGADLWSSAAVVNNLSLIRL